MLGLDEQTEKLEADMKNLSKIDDHDAPTSKKVYKKTVPAV